MNKKVRNLGIIVLAILGIPFLAMLCSSAVKWSLADFILAGILLFGTGILGLVIMQQTSKLPWRILLLALLLIVVLLVWAELAVGIFNSGLAGN
jgi:hypothetical protein